MIVIITLFGLRLHRQSIPWLRVYHSTYTQLWRDFSPCTTEASQCAPSPNGGHPGAGGGIISYENGFLQGIFSTKLFRSGLQLVTGNIFEIKFVEMREPAVAAPDRKVPAANGQIMGTGNMTIPAFCRLNKFPEIITPDLCERSFFTDILDPGNENPGSPAIITHHLSLVRHGLDDLIRIFFTMVTVRPVPREDKTVAHER